MSEVFDGLTGDRVSFQDEQAVLVREHVEILAGLIADRRSRQGQTQSVGGGSPPLMRSSK